MNIRTYRLVRFRKTIALFLILLFTFGILPACTSQPTPAIATPIAAAGSCRLDLPADAHSETAIRAVLNAESEWVVSQDIDALMGLWAADSQVIDAKNTPDEKSDDQTWDGRDAIRHRYVRTVFPGAPSSAQPSDLEITIDGDQASVTSTTRIGDEVSPGGDRWQLVRVNGCWLIQSLTYNLEP
jgi:hypothetical protein